MTEFFPGCNDVNYGDREGEKERQKTIPGLPKKRRWSMVSLPCFWAVLEPTFIRWTWPRRICRQSLSRSPINSQEASLSSPAFNHCRPFSTSIFYNYPPTLSLWDHLPNMGLPNPKETINDHLPFTLISYISFSWWSWKSFLSNATTKTNLQLFSLLTKFALILCLLAHFSQGSFDLQIIQNIFDNQKQE